MTTIPAPQAGADSPGTATNTTGAGKAVLIASGATFLALLDATVVNVAFADLRESFSDVSLSRLTWVITAYAVFFAALLAAAGRLADVLGRRRLFLVSVIGFTLTSLAAAVAPTATVLIIARAAQGATAAGMIPAALGLVLAYTPPAKRAAALGAWGAAGAMAAAVGPSLGGVLVDVWDWRGVFFINIPFGLFLVHGTLRWLRADEPSGRRLPDLVGTLLLIPAIGGPVAGLSQGADWGWDDPAVIGLLLCGAVFGPAVLLRARRHEAPAVELDLWRSKVFSAANATSALFGASMYAWLLACPLFLTTVWQYSVLKAGFGVTPGALTAVVGAVIVGRRVPEDKHWLAVLGGSVLAGASYVAMYAMVDENPSYAVDWLPAGLIAGFGIGCVLTGLSTIAAGALPPARFAAGTGMLMTSRQVGGAVGIAGLAVILADAGPLNSDGFLTGFLWCGVVALVAAAAAVVMRPRTAPDTRTE